MIDTHLHLLPQLDDGPRTPGEAFELARRLVEVGVREAICTPHFSRRFPTDHERALAAHRDLTGVVSTARLPLRLSLAAEFSSAAVVEASPLELRRRRLSAGHVLVELEPDTPAALVDMATARLAEGGLAPVFAHPERCRAVRSQPHVLDRARGAGALVQIIAPSLVGRSGAATEKAAWQLLESGRADLLASDAHRPRHAERLERALALVRDHLGNSTLRDLTVDNPRRVTTEGGG